MEAELSAPITVPLKKNFLGEHFLKPRTVRSQCPPDVATESLHVYSHSRRRLPAILQKRINPLGLLHEIAKETGRAVGGDGAVEDVIKHPLGRAVPKDDVQGESVTLEPLQATTKAPVLHLGDIGPRIAQRAASHPQHELTMPNINLLIKNLPRLLIERKTRGFRVRRGRLRSLRSRTIVQQQPNKSSTNKNREHQGKNLATTSIHDQAPPWSNTHHG